MGEPCTPENIDYLLKTSELLNTCVDKNLIKKMFNLVNPTIID